MTLDIMMPFYGDPAQFKRAVRSVIEQDDPDWRLVIVDDVYPDPEPGEWARGLGDERITYLRNSSNLGVSANYLKCVDLMRAPYAVIMGCDDVMHRGFVGRLRRLREKFPDASMLQTGVTVIDEAGRNYLPLGDRVKGWLRLAGDPPAEYRGEPLARSLLHANWTYFPSLCWQVDLLRSYGFRRDLDVVQDLQMILTIVRHGGSMVVDDEVNFSYRRHSASVSAGTAVDGTRFVQEACVFREARRDMREQGWVSASRAAHARLTSRMNALLQIPHALRGRQISGARTLAAHVVSLK